MIYLAFQETDLHEALFFGLMFRVLACNGQQSWRSCLLWKVLTVPQKDNASSVNRQSDHLTRRDFIRMTAVSVAAMVAVSSVGLADKKTKPVTTSETLAAQLYASCTPEQKKLCAFPFDQPLRNAVDNNWRITKARVGTSFTADQQALIREIFLQLHAPQYADKVMAA